MKSICQPANSAKNLQKNTKFHVILLLDWQYTDNKTISFHWTFFIIKNHETIYIMKMEKYVRSKVKKS